MASTLLRRPVTDEAVQRQPKITTEVVVRVVLVAFAVVISYQFEWRFLRYLTSELNLRLDQMAGIPIERLSYDTVRWGDVVYRYVNACVFADVWCGAVPLLWNLRRTATRNLLALATFTPALFAFNVARLTFSDILVFRGVPWTWGHDFVSGIAYFLVLLGILRWRDFWAEAADSKAGSLLKN